LANEVKTPTLEDAIASFNRGDYFGAAERFEVIGRDTEPELKTMIDAFNRIAAALHLRFERGGRQAAINLLSQAMLTLDDLRPEHAGLDIERLWNELQAYADEVRATPRTEHTGLKHRTRLFLEKRRAPKINPKTNRKD